MRVIRGALPKRPIRRKNYRNCLPELIRDFGGRCAYSMQHQSRCGPLEVDHFDPLKKRDLIQNYKNLFPVSRLCNGKKSNRWPSIAETQAGCRFLNPCEEMDYGEQIFEDPNTHLLIGVTPAAIWHIRICGLNATPLIEERKRRARHWRTIRNRAFRIKPNASPEALAELIQSFREELELMIPEIEKPPVRKTGP